MPERPLAAAAKGADELAIPLLIARLFLLGWALLRLVYCAYRQFDLEGCMAVLVIVAVVKSVTEWSLA